MIDLFIYLGCGLSAGLLGGYLGLGGGILMVPYLTVVAELSILQAVPISVAAIVVNSIASSTEYLRRGMVDLEIVVILSVFMTMGSVLGARVSDHIPVGFMRGLFSIVLLYTAIVFIRGRKKDRGLIFADNRKKMLPLCMGIVLIAGVMSGMIGIGGGVILIPVMYLLIGLPLTTARGTSSFVIGFSAAAATTVYMLNDRIQYEIAVPVALGILIGGKLGGKLGTVAKPLVVRIVFFVLMLYLAIRIGLQEIL